MAPAAALLLLAALHPATAAPTAAPLLQRILTATINTADIAASTALYRDALGYRVVDERRIAATLAASWGAPAMAGRRQALLQPASGADVYLRLVEGTAVPAYRPMNSAGWNAVELLVSDPDRLAGRLRNSAFTALGGPDFLGPRSTIRAAQFAGPSGEVLYFTADTGPIAGSTLARARSAVDRPFIVVLAGRDASAIADFYRGRFALATGLDTALQIPLIARAQRRDPACAYPVVLLRLAEFSHSIEIDGYGERPPRPRHPGEVPPGVAMASFLVDSLDEFPPDAWLQPPAARTAPPYEGRRSATLRGPAGELVELVEHGMPPP